MALRGLSAHGMEADGGGPVTCNINHTLPRMRGVSCVIYSADADQCWFGFFFLPLHLGIIIIIVVIGSSPFSC